MLRVLHTADVHLGARFADLGERAAVQRERQFEAFARTVALAQSERVDLLLVAGDLFDSNTQPRRSVERVADEFARLVEAGIRIVILPGCRDSYDRASIYRAYDLADLAGAPADSGLLTVLTPEQPDVAFTDLGVVVHGRVVVDRATAIDPIAGLGPAADGRAAWRIGLAHGALASAAKGDVVDRPDRVIVTKEAIATSGLDYLALGHGHERLVGKAGSVVYAYSGAPEPVAIGTDTGGHVLLVELDDTAGRRRVEIDERRIGATRFERVEVDAGTIGTQAALIAELSQRADPNLILEASLTGVRPDSLDVDPTEVETALAGSFLRFRLRERSLAALSDLRAIPPDTILGAFVRDLEARIGETEKAGRADEAIELRESLRTGRLLLSGEEVVL